jgi:hypothetical protein
MTIHLQDRNTGLYFGGANAWAASPAAAHPFVCSAQALEVRQQLGAKELNLVFRFAEQGYAIELSADDPTAQL